MSSEMLERVRSWLESSGRAFELRVARTFRQTGANRVEQSFVYTDPVTDVHREGDVLAYFGWTGVGEQTRSTITAVVECKSSKKDPWVAFFDRSLHPGRDLSSWVYFSAGPDPQLDTVLGQMWIGQPPFDEPRVATHVVASMHRDDTVNKAHDAIRQVLSAAEAQRQLWLDNQADRRNLVVIPLVVTAAPLVACTLNDSGDLDLQEIDRFVAWGYTRHHGRKRVFVLKEDQVPAMSTAFAQLALQAHEEARFRREV
jgi:hypothetical protein